VRFAGERLEGMSYEYMIPLKYLLYGLVLYYPALYCKTLAQFVDLNSYSEALFICVHP
jgi:hypothetical protein